MPHKSKPKGKPKQSTRKMPAGYKCRTPSLGDFVLVEWSDACGSPRWTCAEDSHLGLSPIVSAGFIVAKEKDRITISGDLDRSAGNVGRLLSIPTGGITAIKVCIEKCAEPGFFLASDAQRMAVNASRNCIGK